jgi:acetyl esterase/lipase
MAGLALALGASMAVAEPASLDQYMKQARRAPAAVIHYGPAASQVAELFLPPTTKASRGPLPVVVLLHGGCFLKQYEGFPQTSTLAADLAGRGYAVWNLEYRKLGEAGAGYPGTFQDVATGIDALRAQAPKYDLDLNRVIAVGHSAGGHLALWAASRGKLPVASPLKTADPLKIGAVISLAGIGDLDKQGGVFGLPCGDRVVMVHGVFDPVMPPYTGRDYVLRVRKAGDKADVVVIQNAAHFDLVIPTTPAWAEVVGVLNREMKALSAAR